MSGLNQATLIGNLGQDPELKVTPGGQAVLKLRLATTESYLDRNNTRQERTEWHSVTVWGKRGEALAKILKKGGQIGVVGRIHTSSSGEGDAKKYFTEIVANDVILLGGKYDGSPTQSARYGKSGAGANAKHTAPPETDTFGGAAGDAADAADDSDIPF